MDKAHPLSSPMVVSSIDVKKDSFCPREKGEELLCPEVPYLCFIGALMYLANCTCLDISFSITLLAMYSFVPTQKTFQWCQTYIVLLLRNNLYESTLLKKTKATIAWIC